MRKDNKAMGSNENKVIERATYREKTIPNKRASNNEETNGIERAIEGKKPIGDKRAMLI